MGKLDHLIARLQSAVASDGWDVIAIHGGITYSPLTAAQKDVCRVWIEHEGRDDATGEPHHVKIGVRLMAKLSNLTKEWAIRTMDQLVEAGAVERRPAPSNRTPEVCVARFQSWLLALLEQSAESPRHSSGVLPEGTPVSYQREHQVPPKRSFGVPSSRVGVPSSRVGVPSSRVGVLLGGTEGTLKELEKEPKGDRASSARRTAGTDPTLFDAQAKRPERASKEDDGPTPAPIPKPKRQPKAAPERTDEQRAAHTTVMAAYCAEFERRRGTKPAIGGAEGIAVYRLLEAVRWDPEQATTRIRHGLADGAWPPDATVREIAANPDRYAQPPRQGMGRDVPRQRNTTPNPFDILRKAANQ